MKRMALASALCLLTLSLAARAASMGKKDIVDTAVAAGDFKTLAAALQAAGLVDTLKDVKIMAQGGKVMVDNADVTKTDIVCSNGVIHVIDSVILPQ